MDIFNSKILPSLIIWLNSFKHSHKIIILGERNIGINIETTMHKTTSLYDNLLLLKSNNDVIDLTHNILTLGNPTFNDFLTDIKIINGSKCNITFGIGGPFTICKAFSKNNISFLPYFHLNQYKRNIEFMNIIDNTIVQSIDELNKKLLEIN